MWKYSEEWALEAEPLLMGEPAEECTISRAYQSNLPSQANWGAINAIVPAQTTSKPFGRNHGVCFNPSSTKIGAYVFDREFMCVHAEDSGAPRKQ